MTDTPRRLLAISWELPPLAGPRALQVARTLEGLTWHGWHSTALTLSPRVGGTALRDAAGLPEMTVPGVTLVPVRSLEEQLPWRLICRAIPDLAARPDRSRPWIRPATRRGLQELRRRSHDVIISFAQPWSDHLIGLRLAQAAGLPWVAHFSDPWTDSPYEPVASASTRALRRRLEADVITAADAVVFVTRETANLVMQKYPALLAHKVHVVPHSFDPRQAGERRAPRRGAALRIVHTGRFYREKRTPVALFQALANLRKTGVVRRDIELVLIGAGAAEYSAHAQALGIADLVTVHERVPYADALRHAAEADVLMFVDAVVPPPNPFLPSKVIDYLPFRRPLLGLTDPTGASGTLVLELGGWVAPPDDVPQIAQVVEQMLREWRAGNLRVGSRFDEVAQSYEMRRTAGEFARVLESVV
jgi:glycosyltransferase involved in cell wall biosynthesis